MDAVFDPPVGEAEDPPNADPDIDADARPLTVTPTLPHSCAVKVETSIAHKRQSVKKRLCAAVHEFFWQGKGKATWLRSTNRKIK